MTVHNFSAQYNTEQFNIGVDRGVHWVHVNPPPQGGEKIWHNL